jgi:plasmid stabilization system protein ParE
VIELRFHPGAAQELREAARYYERQVGGLGAAFITEMERTTAMILENPGLGAAVWLHYRRVVVERFPFTVVYRIRDDVLHVLSVAHADLKPDSGLPLLEPAGPAGPRNEAPPGDGESTTCAPSFSLRPVAAQLVCRETWRTDWR